MSEERFARQPDHDVGVLAEGPQHCDSIDFVESLAKDENTLAFKLIQTIHDCLPTDDAGTSSAQITRKNRE